jgi:hypothetical protein
MQLIVPQIFQWPDRLPFLPDLDFLPIDEIEVFADAIGLIRILNVFFQSDGLFLLSKYKDFWLDMDTGQQMKDWKTTDSLGGGFYLKTTT